MVNHGLTRTDPGRWPESPDDQGTKYARGSVWYDHVKTLTGLCCYKPLTPIMLIVLMVGLVSHNSLSVCNENQIHGIMLYSARSVKLLC